MDRAVGAARERFANDLRDTRRPGRADDHFAAVLLFQTQRLFERVGVGLVHLEAGVAFTDPGLIVVQAGLPLARRHLLDANRNFHASNLLNRSAAFVPPNPKEFDSAYVMRTGRLLSGT